MESQYLNSFNFNEEELEIISLIAPKLRMLRKQQQEISYVYSFKCNARKAAVEKEKFPVLKLQNLEAVAKEYSDFVALQTEEPGIVIFEDKIGFALGENIQAAIANYHAWLDQNSAARAENLTKQAAETPWKTSLFQKVCFITGGAQGLGKGITEYLLSQGAYVIIGDLNEEGAQKTAAALTKTYGFGSVAALKINVSDEASVKLAVQKMLCFYGGIDLFVSNAGVLKAGSIDELSFADFQFVTNVNYYGYFLTVKYISKIMKQQHEINPNYWMDIIQINSKSGLIGSNKNSAYAGSKFGGIGLTQSFALELVDYAIKVNAICPGNNLDGPLWMDPEKGLLVQYLKAGKVPGAKTVEDVKAFYMAKVPINRGCHANDLGVAISYLVQQAYETGQALPVTGGQEMLN